LQSKIKVVDKVGRLCNLGGGTGMAITSAPPGALISGRTTYIPTTEVKVFLELEGFQ
jgi:hypothetical protein